MSRRLRGATHLKLKFNDLPQAVRERLVKLTAPGGEQPRVLVSDADWAGGWFT